MKPCGKTIKLLSAVTLLLALCLGTFSAQAAACITPPSGIVSWWPAEGNASDIVRTNNGVLHGGLSFASGNVGQAFNFDGTAAYVSMAATSSLNVGLSNGFTIECWINPSDVSSTHIILEYNN